MSTSSLRDYDNIADRIKLARQHDRRPVLVVEGPTDRRFAIRVLPPPEPEFYVAGTRADVIAAARDVDRLQLRRVACVVDRDFDDVVAAAESDGLPVAAYENGDLEAMLWFGITLEDLLAEMGSVEKVATFGGVDALRAIAVEVLSPLARLRRANASNGWGIRFDDLDLASKVDRRTLSISVQSLCDALWSEDLGISKSDLYDAAGDDGPQPCCPTTGAVLLRGRDALAVTAVALRRLLGNLTHQSSSVDRIAEALRLAARRQGIEPTSWFKSVTDLLRV